jgi:hypothetical protein
MTIIIYCDLSNKFPNIYIYNIIISFLLITFHAQSPGKDSMPFIIFWPEKNGLIPQLEEAASKSLVKINNNELINLLKRFK